MVSKDFLKKEFARDFKKHYSTELFKKKGFEHRVCPKCGKGFWSIEKEECGDSSHERYSFFKEKPIKISYVDFWKKTSDFWKKNGHKEIPRYPVLSRWRDDLYFTIASIVDFQRLENDRIVFEYPANPLIVPQICLRFNDIANVGITSSHFTCFNMTGQHAFNYPKEGYWKDECIDLNFKYLTQVLGIEEKEITYAEDVWSMPDFSAFGPCIESFSKGIELVNSVFMQYYWESESMKELDIKVVDVGWGFERLLWYYTGETTAYEAVFPKEIDFMKKKSGFSLPKDLFMKYAQMAGTLNIDESINLREEKRKIAEKLGMDLETLEKTISPIQAIYSIADHSRCLLFALADGGMPSNSAGGYNLRIVLRRALNFIKEYSFDFSLFDIVQMHAIDLKPLFPELAENLEGVKKILEVEERKYEESFEKARKLAGEVISREGQLTTEKMVLLYESNGVTPELLERVAKESGKQISVPQEFYQKITEKHLMEEKKAKPFEVSAKPTKLVYYQDPDKTELIAKVVAKEKNAIVFDKTIFYPEGGGQMSDKGTVTNSRGETSEIYEAQKSKGIVFHYLKNEKEVEKFKEGEEVRISIDAKRRAFLRKHHSATHILIASCRDVLGKHVWQAGSKKDEEEAHVDITHFEKLSREERDKIEFLANSRVFAGKKISVIEMERGEAERKYGFRLYQGGGAIGKFIRVIEIEGIDVEACGGLHCTNTSQIGLIKITGVEQVQDGIIRIYFKGGEKAIAHIQRQERLFEDACSQLSCSKSELPNSIKRFFEEWKCRGKELEDLQEELAKVYSTELMHGLESQKFVEKNIGKLSQKMVEKIALEISKREGWAALISNQEKFAVAACNEKSGKNAQELLRQKGRGGGNQFFARGKLN